MKKISVIDWCMVIAFIATIATGFGMHIAGHGNTHPTWEIWAIVHSLAAITFVIIGAMHIKTHWGWYKAWLKNGLGNKSRVTIILSVIYAVVLISGVALFCINGVNSHLGLLHYKIGILFTAIGIGHIIKRIPVLRKSLKN